MPDAVAALAAFAQKLARLPEHMPEIMRQLGEECVDLIKAGHDAGADPYGEDWKPKADGSDCHLFDMGNLRGGWHITEASASEVTVAPTAWSAAVHQGGAVINAKSRRGLRFKVGGRWVRKMSVQLPKRAMVPDGRGLPAAWQDALAETANTTLEHLIGK